MGNDDKNLWLKLIKKAVQGEHIWIVMLEFLCEQGELQAEL